MTRIALSLTLDDRIRKAMAQRGVPIDREPEAIEQWIETNVTDLASAKAALKMLALDVMAIKHLMRVALERRRT